MRLPIITLATAASLIIATPAGAVGRHKKASEPCPSTHTVVVADTQAEVYMAPERPQNPEFLGVYGCSYRSKHAYFLGSVPEAVATPAGTGGVKREALAGPFAAYEEGSGGPTGAEWVVTVRDLLDGKVLYSAPTGTPAHPEPLRVEGGLTHSYVGIGPTTAIVVKSDGTVAWIVQTPAEDGYYQVHALDKTGSRVLASGLEIEPHSLALAGSTLYWTQGGKPMSSTLN